MGKSSLPSLGVVGMGLSPGDEKLEQQTALGQV